MCVCVCGCVSCGGPERLGRVRSRRAILLSTLDQECNVRAWKRGGGVSKLQSDGGRTACERKAREKKSGHGMVKKEMVGVRAGVQNLRRAPQTSRQDGLGDPDDEISRSGCSYGSRVGMRDRVLTSAQASRPWATRSGRSRSTRPSDHSCQTSVFEALRDLEA